MHLTYLKQHWSCSSVCKEDYFPISHLHASHAGLDYVICCELVKFHAWNINYTPFCLVKSEKSIERNIHCRRFYLSIRYKVHHNTGIRWSILSFLLFTIFIQPYFNRVTCSHELIFSRALFKITYLNNK